MEGCPLWKKRFIEAKKLIPNKRHFWRGPIPLNIRLSGILIAKIILFFKTQANKYIFFDLWSIFLDLKF